MWMNPSLTPTAGDTQSLSIPSPVELPAGFTVADAIRIGEAITASHAESTRTVYGHAWNKWQRWCASRDLAPMPAPAALICAYLTERATEGVTFGTLDLACRASAYHHIRYGLHDPTLNDQPDKIILCLFWPNTATHGAMKTLRASGGCSPCARWQPPV